MQRWDSSEHIQLKSLLGQKLLLAPKNGRFPTLERFQADVKYSHQVHRFLWIEIGTIIHLMFNGGLYDYLVLREDEPQYEFEQRFISIESGEGGWMSYSCWLTVEHYKKYNDFKWDPLCSDDLNTRLPQATLGLIQHVFQYQNYAYKCEGITRIELVIKDVTAEERDNSLHIKVGSARFHSHTEPYGQHSDVPATVELAPEMSRACIEAGAFKLYDAIRLTYRDKVTELSKVLDRRGTF